MNRQFTKLALVNVSLAAVSICFGFSSSFGQATQTEDTEGQNRAKGEAAFNRRVDSLRNVGKDKIIRDRYKEERETRRKLKILSRKLTAEEKLLLAPEEKDVSRFKQELSENGWGLTKLVAEQGCSDNPEVIVSTKHCLKYQMPGAGASFSFRTEGYRIKRIADLSYTGSHFDTKGVMKHGVLVDIGDVDLASLNRKSTVLSTLIGFRPASDANQARNFATILEKGVSGGKFFYSSTLPVKEGTTFVLRSIAYRGGNPKKIDDLKYGVLDFDKRRDVLIAFRIVRKDAAEKSITILWKMLSNQKSPKLKRGKS